MNAGAKGRPKTAAINAIQQRIDTLNERYSNNEIDLQLYLDGLSTVVARQYKYSRTVNKPVTVTALFFLFFLYYYLCIMFFIY
jgi:hypothetical protein